MDIEALKSWKNWTDHAKNPLIHPTPPDWIIADPTFIPPHDSPDTHWHLFAHGILSGINHFISTDGIVWKNTGQEFDGGLRPFLFKEDDVYYLLFEKNFTPFYGRIAISQSFDLYHWTKHKHILTPTLSWEGRIARRIGNPCLVKHNGTYRLYYSAGSVFLWDSLVPEPKYIGLAEAKTIFGRYKKHNKPIIAPSKKHRFRNHGAGAIKVIQMDNFWLGFNNGIFEDHEGRSRSSILLLYSMDGIVWNKVFKNPIIYPTHGWKRAYVYQLDVKKIGTEYWLYYNARNGWVSGIESIGLATLKKS
ncbi:MAG: family 43 glycosylhydrolase [Candidatus Helarchaeota archaeon]